MHVAVDIVYSSLGCYEKNPADPFPLPVLQQKGSKLSCYYDVDDEDKDANERWIWSATGKDVKG